MTAHPTLPPWSFKRRLTVTVIATLTIFSVALILGGSLFATTSWLGLTSSQDLRTQAYSKALSDPKLLHTIANRAQAQSCHNPLLGIAYEYWHPFRVTNHSGANACVQLVASTAQGNMSHVTLKRAKGTKSQVLDELVGSLEEVITDTFARDQLTGTFVEALYQGQRLHAYVVENGHQVWIITLYPSDDYVLSQFQPILTSLSR